MASTGPKVTGTIYYNGGGTWTTAPTTTIVNTSDDSRAIAPVGSDVAVFGDQDFSAIPSRATINGIELIIEGSSGTAAATVNFDVSLSKDGGASFPFVKSSSFTGTTDASNTLGSSVDLWGTTWVDTNFGFGAFAFAVGRTGGTGTLRIDFVTVNIYYTASGAYGVTTRLLMGVGR